MIHGGKVEVVIKNYQPAPYLQRALAEYLLFHHGSAEQILPWTFGPVTALDYPTRCVSECLEVARLPARARALDLGCAVGRSTFELARHCSEVTGIDDSHRFIEVARHLQQHGSMPYAYVEEGHLTTPAMAVVPAEIDRHRITFEQGDAQDLRPDLGLFDVVLLANLVDRLREPRRCLGRLSDLVRLGGQLIVTMPGTWLEDYTPRSEWLGGFEHDGRPVLTLDTLQALFAPHLTLARTLELPFLIHDFHARPGGQARHLDGCFRGHGARDTPGTREKDIAPSTRFHNGDCGLR